MAEIKPDWTSDENGRSNSSETFCKLCDEIERLIRNDAHSIVSGNAGSTARLIMAQLAHVHGLAPISIGDLLIQRAIGRQEGVNQLRKEILGDPAKAPPHS